MTDADTPSTLLGGLTVRQFLSEYWQKKPLLIRQAFARFESPVSPDELAGMALEPDTHVRLVQEKHPERPWHVSYAPLDNNIFSRLPESDWTFLVTDCEKHWPELRDLVEPFRFIPDWRIDDLMISYAAPGGSVGPHIDEYDVFLLQLHGQRQWMFHELPTVDEVFIDDIELKILTRFTPDHDRVLNPGDLLYLPPRVAHHGVGIGGGCMTASIGFRAPEQAKLVENFLDDRLDQIDENARYADPDLQPHEHPSEIKSEHLDRLWQLIETALAMPKDQRHCWLGKFLTQQNDDLTAETLDPGAFDAELDDGALLERSGFSRMAYQQTADGIWLFANGQAWQLPLDCLTDVQALCDYQPVGLKSLRHPQHLRPILRELYEQEALDWT